MTTSPSHRGASSRIEEIRKELGYPTNVLMVFVVPEEVVASFSFPRDLPNYVEMYVTTPKHMNLAEANKLRSR